MIQSHKFIHSLEELLDQSYDLFFLFFFSPGLDGLPLPTTPSTKKARAGQLNKKDQIAKSLKVPVLINAAHLRRGIRGDDLLSLVI